MGIAPSKGSLPITNAPVKLVLPPHSTLIGPTYGYCLNEPSANSTSFISATSKPKNIAIDSGIHICVEPESTKHFISVDFSGCLGFESFTTVCTNPMILIFTKITLRLGIVNANVLRFSQLRQPRSGCRNLNQFLVAYQSNK